MNVRETHDPFARLLDNFIEVLKTPQMALNEQLDVVPGKRSRAPHNKILAQTLRILEATPAESVSSLKCLTLFRDTIRIYLEKIERSSKIAAKSKGKSIQIDQEIPRKIFARIGAIQHVISAAPVPKRDLKAEIKKYTITDELDRIKLHQCVTGATTEWSLLQACELTSSLLRQTLSTRKHLVDLGYRLVKSKSYITLYPPDSYFEAAWPVLLLGIRLGKILKNLSVHPEEKFRSALALIQKGLAAYPQYRSNFDALLMYAKHSESQYKSGLMIIDVLKSVSSIQDHMPTGAMGCAIRVMANELDSMKLIILRSNEKGAEFDSTTFPSMEQRIAVGSDLENADALIKEHFVEIISQSVSIFKQSLPYLNDVYIEAYTKLAQYEESHSGKHSPQSVSMKFAPAISMQIFSNKSLFYPYILPHPPTPEELLKFSPVVLPSYLDEPLEPSIGKDRALPQPTNHEFLPKQHRASPQNRKPAKHKEKKTPPDIEEHLASPTHDDSIPVQDASKPPLIEQMEHLSLDPHLPVLQQESPRPPSPFSFKVGDSAPPSLQFGWHVRRWNTPRYNPFVDDEKYSTHTYSPQTQESIRFQHTPPLALISVILECGERYLSEDFARESFFLPAEAIWHDGTARYEKGVITVGRNRLTGHIFHYCFSQLAPSTLCQNYARNRFYRCEEEVPLPEPITEQLGAGRTLPCDGSRISQIEDTGMGSIAVTIDDPRRQITVDVYLELT